ncbi:hypothetical protein FRX31_002074 [Thalictrum thalictroides]|uniref:Uncharacterized protein n=1 Tax=Thalictrum thalictroides TaxID=46969 RepID=A0A7J6XGT1_THATH|nr:hypothetical protein FRX31_002074 [Thalictrum thalictroides]
MSSLDSESDSESSLNSDSFSISKQLLDEQNKDARLISSNMTQKLVQFTTTCILILVSTMFMDGKGPYGGSTFGRRYIHRDSKERHELIINDYFKVGKCGLSPLQMMIAALRILAYGCAVDLLDEYVQIGESMAIESIKHFCDVIIGFLKNNI